VYFVSWCKLQETCFHYLKSKGEKTTCLESSVPESSVPRKVEFGKLVAVPATWVGGTWHGVCAAEARYRTGKRGRGRRTTAISARFFAARRAANPQRPARGPGGGGGFFFIFNTFLKLIFKLILFIFFKSNIFDRAYSHGGTN